MDIFCARIARAARRVGVKVHPERVVEHPIFIQLTGSECAALSRAVRNISPIPDDAEAVLALLDPHAEGYVTRLLTVDEAILLVTVLESASGVVELRRRARAARSSVPRPSNTQPLTLAHVAAHRRRMSSPVGAMG